jgi:hypothetical protein
MIATYPPRRCGIATFTRDLRTALVGTADEESHRSPRVVALDHGRGDPRAYPPEVILRLRRDRQAYRDAGRELAAAGVEVVSLQHEYGIFGGPAGRGVLDLVEGLPMPVVTTLHTILEHPQPLQRSILAELVNRSARVVVMSELGRRRLRNIYSAPASIRARADAAWASPTSRCSSRSGCWGLTSVSKSSSRPWPRSATRRRQPGS